jgi:hypothetical protein
MMDSQQRKVPWSGTWYFRSLGPPVAVEVAVLRITPMETTQGALLRVEGRLAGPWVEELAQVCLTQQVPLRLDLRGLQSTDLAGRELLRRLARAGTQFVQVSGYVAALLAEPGQQ